METEILPACRLTATSQPTEAATNQNIGNIKYAFSNGAANLFFTGSYQFE